MGSVPGHGALPVQTKTQQTSIANSKTTLALSISWTGIGREGGGEALGWPGGVVALLDGECTQRVCSNRQPDTYKGHAPEHRHGVMVSPCPRSRRHVECFGYNYVT